MSFPKLAGLYAICTAVFFAVDLVWLTVATKRFYQPYIGSLLSDEPKLGVAAAFYLAYVVGVVALAVIPGLKEGALVGALWRGALFGFLAYATYDLTNLATLRGWHLTDRELDVMAVLWELESGTVSEVRDSSFEHKE